MTESTDPAATDDRPAEAPTLEGSLNGSLMDELRQMVEQRVTPLVNPEPEPITSDAFLSDLSENEREQHDAEQARLRAELDALAAENELLGLGREYPREVGILTKMLQAESVEGWVRALHEAMNPTREPEQEVADVDRNNPPGGPIASIARLDPRDVIHLPDGSLITREEGWRILSQARSLHD